MKKNFLIVTIDALSKWYIDQVRMPNDFWTYLEKETLNFSDMYATGPFTEAAVRGFWSGAEPLFGSGYLSETNFSNETIFEQFLNDSYYMYLGQLVPYINNKMKYNNDNVNRENMLDRAFEHIWNNRIIYYINLYNKKNLEEKDYWKIQFILDEFFDKYNFDEKGQKQKIQYYKNKRMYIKNIMDKNIYSEFYKTFYSQLFYDCQYPNIVKYKKQLKHNVSKNEAIFIKKSKNKNIQYLFDFNRNNEIEIEKQLRENNNRCIFSNNDLLSHMRDENENLPKLNEEIDDFLNWYDKYSYDMDKPYFAYIHNYDFHYPENFLNSRYESVEYEQEILNKINLLDEINEKKMSVSKQLSILNIEKNLKYLFTELSKRNAFSNTILIITSDHGISNFMYKIGKNEERWNYTKTNFNIPFYVIGKDLPKYQFNGLYDSKIIKQIFEDLKDEKFNIKKYQRKEKEYLTTAWINGVPDLDRNNIKIGIRNKHYSITLEGLFTQKFDTLIKRGIYNLDIDPDELNCNSKQYPKTMIEQLKKEWINLSKRIINESDYRYGYKDRYAYIEKEYFNYNEDNSISSIEDLKCKNIIVFGRGVQATEFLSKYGSLLKVKEIWDNYINSSKEYYFGHTVKKPDIAHFTNDDFIIICSRYEADVCKKLNDIGVKANRYIMYEKFKNIDKKEKIWM